MKIYTNEEINKRIKNKNRFYIAIKLFLYPIVALIIIASLYLCIQKIQNPNQVSNIMGYRAFSVTSGSMEPNIKIGDLVIVKQVNSLNDITNGDIITYREKDSFVTHRVVDIVNEQGKKVYITKGDNNNANDNLKVSFESIEGKYVKHVPFAGQIVMSCQNVYFIILVLIGAYCIYSIFSNREDRRIYRHEKRLEYEKNEAERAL